MQTYKEDLKTQIYATKLHKTALHDIVDININTTQFTLFKTNFDHDV